MNPAAARDHYTARAEAFARTRTGEPAWLGRLRAEALAAFAESGLPHGRLEEWRYTNVAPIARVGFERSEAGAAISRDGFEEVCSPVFACTLFPFVDGGFRPELAAPRAIGSEPRVESLAKLAACDPGLLEPHLGRLVDPKLHPFAALNTAFLADGAVLVLPPGTRAEQPIHLVFAASGSEPDRVQHPRLLVVAGEGSRAQVVVDHVALGPHGGFSNAVGELHVGRNAELDLVLIQRETRAPGTLACSNLAARLERDARLFTHSVTLAGRLVRNDLSVVLADEGAECRLHGLFVGRGERLVDNHTLVDHAVPHGRSRELYKGILAGSSRGVFRGRVLVRPDAQKTDADQSNPNLLLGAGAEIDSKPQLEIHADDVRCSHGSSIGRIDQDALFYLRSRGLAEATARDLLVRGFAAEVLDSLAVPGLAATLDELLRAELTAGAEEAVG